MPALLSQQYRYSPLSRSAGEAFKTVLRRAWPTRNAASATLHPHARRRWKCLAELSDGDARRALMALEVGVLSTAERPVSVHERRWRNVDPAQALDYDAAGNAHYDVASNSWEPCAAAIRMRRCTGWRGCWKPAKCAVHRTAHIYFGVGGCG